MQVCVGRRSGHTSKGKRVNKMYNTEKQLRSHNVSSELNFEGSSTGEGVIQTAELPSDIPRVISVSLRTYDASRKTE